MLRTYIMLDIYRRKLGELLNEEDGQDLIEYALLVGLISIAAIVAITAAGGSVNNMFTAVSNALAGAEANVP